MFKAARILEAYQPDWGGYPLIKRMSELILQKAAYIPSFSLTRILTGSQNAQNRTFRMHVSDDGLRLYCNTVNDASIECWDLQTGRLPSRFATGERLSEMLVDEAKGLILCIGTEKKTTGQARELSVLDKAGSSVRTVRFDTYHDVENAAVTADGKWLAVTCTDYLSDSTVYVFPMMSDNDAPIIYPHPDSA